MYKNILSSPIKPVKCAILMERIDKRLAKIKLKIVPKTAAWLFELYPATRYIVAAVDNIDIIRAAKLAIC